MKFEKKMSGTSVKCDIKPLFNCGIISLKDVMEKDLSQEGMNFILDTIRFYRGERTDENGSECIWWATIDYDTRCKLAVLEKTEYEKYKREFIEYFGGNWIKHYIRFNH